MDVRCSHLVMTLLTSSLFIFVCGGDIVRQLLQESLDWVRLLNEALLSQNEIFAAFIKFSDGPSVNLTGLSYLRLCIDLWIFNWLFAQLFSCSFLFWGLRLLAFWIVWYAFPSCASDFEGDLWLENPIPFVIEKECLLRTLCFFKRRSDSISCLVCRKRHLWSPVL